MSLSDKFLFNFVSWSMKLRQLDVQLFSPKLLSLLLLQCFVENVVLKFLHICRRPEDVLIFPKVFSCAGTKWFFSLNYVPPNKHLKMTLKLFHIQSPTESIADKLSFFLMLRPTPLRQEIAVTVCCSLLCQGDVNQNSTALTFL